MAASKAAHERKVIGEKKEGGGRGDIGPLLDYGWNCSLFCLGIYCHNFRSANILVLLKLLNSNQNQNPLGYYNIKSLDIITVKQIGHCFFTQTPRHYKRIPGYLFTLLRRVFS